MKNALKATLKACFHYFLLLHQMIALLKLWKMLFISSKKPLFVLQCSNFCKFCPSCQHFGDTKGPMKVEQFMMLWIALRKLAGINFEITHNAKNASCYIIKKKTKNKTKKRKYIKLNISRTKRAF